MSRKGKHDDDLIMEEMVVLAKKHVEVLLDRRELLEPSARRIQHINAEIKNVVLDVMVVKMEEEHGEARIRIKVIIQGILNKEIVWLGKDNMMHHMTVNEPFSTFLLFTDKDMEKFGSIDPDEFDFDPDRITAQVWNAEVEGVVSHLISPNRLQEKVILGFEILLKQRALVQD